MRLRASPRQEFRDLVEPSLPNLRRSILKRMRKIQTSRDLCATASGRFQELFHFGGRNYAVASAGNDFYAGTIRREMIDRIVASRTAQMGYPARRRIDNQGMKVSARTHRI